MKTNVTSMSSLEILLRVIRRVGLFSRFSQHLIRQMVSKDSRRRKLNARYNQMSIDEKSVFHSIFCKAFRENNASMEKGVWIVDFLDTKVKLPLRSDTAWLDWDNAISIVGHDSDVKMTYEVLLKSKYRPSVFFDIGANYGTHSLLFLSQGVTAVAFEPNLVCKKEFEEFCRLNGFNGKMENIAIGDQEKIVDFWFPEKDTWLGTMVEKTKDGLQGHDLNKTEVSLVTLDKYVERNNLLPDLIKIDTEGNELSVIKGGLKTIETAKPLIIFECNELNDKNELWHAFRKLDYVICALPLSPALQAEELGLEKFLSNSKHNFIALPKNHAIFRETVSPSESN